jgi:hypothetical protein
MRIELKDSLDSLFPDSTVGKKPVRRMLLDVARGATASVHVLVNDVKAGSRVGVKVHQSGREVREARWFRLIDVPVEVNTGPMGFVEREGERNRFVIRRAPFRVCDAMEPIARSVKAEASMMALRLHVSVPPNARAGLRKYAIEIVSGKEKQTLALGVRVHRAVVPTVGKESLPYTNWFSLQNMASRHGLKVWSDAHWRMIRRYANLMVRGRQNAFWIPLSEVFRVKRKTPVLDREKLRRIVRTFTSAGMHFIEGGHVASRTGGEWNATTFDVVFTRERAISVKGNAALANLCGQLMDEIVRNGWQNRWIQHVADEPTLENATDFRVLAGMVRRHMPGIPLLDATIEPRLAGTLDVWCPQAQHYQQHRRFFDAQRLLGDRVWFYTCCFPGGPWLNRLLDMELLRPALFGWAAALYGLDGFLHWGLNHYGKGQNPFEQSVVPHGGGTCLPAGDTHVVYPGKDAPWSSLRFEAQREGFEDYELLKQLSRRDPRAAGRIAGRTVRAFNRFTKDIRAFRAARRSLLEAAWR